MKKFSFALLALCLAGPLFAQTAPTLEEQKRQTELLQQILEKLGGPVPPGASYQASLASAWNVEPAEDKTLGPALTDVYSFAAILSDSSNLGKLQDYWALIANFEALKGTTDRLAGIHAVILRERAKQVPEAKDSSLTPALRAKAKAFVQQTAEFLKAVTKQPLPPPVPPPGPTPPPEPTPAGKLASFVVGVTDNGNRTTTEAIILTSDGLAKWLAENKVSWRVFDINSQAAKDYKIEAFLSAKKITAPAMIAWFDGDPKAAPAPPTEDAVKLFVQGKTIQRMFEDPKGGKFEFFQEGGHRRWLTRIAPPKGFKMAGVRSFKEAIGVIPESQWREVNRRQAFPASWTMDQNGHGSCVGHGSTAALERIRHQTGMTRIPLSPTCTYAQINGGRDNGAMIGDSLIALQKTGTIPMSMFGESKIYLSQLPKGWKDVASRFRIEQAYTTASFAEQVSAVQLGYVVVNCVMVGNNFDAFDRYGVAGFARGGGNHCIMADGCAKLPDGRWVLDIQNSWGQAWGPWKNGRCYFEARHIDQSDNSDCYAIKTAVEDPQENIRPPALRLPMAPMADPCMVEFFSKL